MISFENDYSEGTAKEILTRLTQLNETQTSGYGVDKHCKEAEKLIREAVGSKDVDVHFVPGGTQCNILAASMLAPYEGIICATTGHINVHETGAIENTGHKCLAINAKDGKLTPALIQEVFDIHTDEHMVKPAMVFISNSTELGTIYTKKEIVAISKLCKKLGLYLYMDGARLGSALMAKGNDLKLTDFVKLVDMFYIGGTKNGALLGEAMVVINPVLKKNFRYLLKNKGTMLAKARVMGISFAELFKNNLYFDLASHANKMAEKLNKCFHETNTKMVTESTSNQIFVVLDNTLVKKLKKKYVFNASPIDKNTSSCRFVTSWCTKEENVNTFINDYKNLLISK